VRKADVEAVGAGGSQEQHRSLGSGIRPCRADEGGAGPDAPTGAPQSALLADEPSHRPGGLPRILPTAKEGVALGQRTGHFGRVCWLV